MKPLAELEDLGAGRTDVPPSQRPTIAPPARHSELRVRADGPSGPGPARARIPVQVPSSVDANPVRVDPGWVPLVVDRAPLIAHPPPLVTSLIVACMNGDLTVGELSELTGVPLGAVADAVLDLVRQGVVLLELRVG